MTGARIVGTWSARDASAAAGDAQIRQFRRRHPAGAVRQAVRTLVVVADRDRTEGLAAAEAAWSIGARSPGRTVVLVTVPDQASGTDAAVTVRVVEHPNGSSTCSEEVVLVARGAAAGNLASIVRPWLLPGLPVVVWLPARLLRTGEPVVAAADRVVVDSRRLTSASPLADVLAAGRSLPLRDLAWGRLHAWRLALAGLFAGADFSPFARGVERVDAAGRQPTAALLAGWLVSGLDLAPDVVRLEDADRVSVGLRARSGGRTATFSLVQSDRDPDGRTVHLSASIAGGSSHRRTVRLGPQAIGADLERVLSPRPTRDDVWWQALCSAVALA
jgi:glucose-6-phosphate dehydrogenase assembly protein OpcA